MSVPPLLRAMRPHQWSKNVFVLAGLAFAVADRTAVRPLDLEAALPVLATLAAFCLGSSAIYLLNDVLDVESDRAHPEKRRRPIASGELPVRTALLGSVACAVAALALGTVAGGAPVPVVALVAIYMAMNLAYSVRLKHVALVDAFCIASGFLLRVLAGGLAAGVAISHWLLLCTLFLALFLAFEKRRSEVALLGDGKGDHRAILDEYPLGFLDQLVTVLAACTIVSYAMWTVDDSTAEKFGGSAALPWSVPFVVFGVARYMHLAQRGHDAGNPTRVFLGGDTSFLVNTLLWAAVVGAGLAGLF